MDWFLYDMNFRHERVNKQFYSVLFAKSKQLLVLFITLFVTDNNFFYFFE